jgi:V8-like Glu-specific endopeptidase
MIKLPRLFCAAGLAVAALVVVPTAANAGVAAASTVVRTEAATRSGVDDFAALKAENDAYWTPQRMRDAIPADKVDVKPSTPAEKGSPTGTAAELAAPAKGQVAANRVAGTTSPPVAQVYATPTVGKVFFHDESDGKNYVCSGSTINNPAANMVSTAGHCVHHGNGGKWHSQWRFVPYYDHGATPYGVWYAHWLTTFNGWSNSGSYDWDVAFVNVWSNGGSNLINVVGGNGLRVNYPKTVYVTIMGYPAAPPFDGQWQYFCQGNTYPRWFTDQIGFDCLMTGGSSGGPFFQDYNDYYGYVNGVISNGPDTTSYSPYFDTDVANLYYSVQNLV